MIRFGKNYMLKGQRVVVVNPKPDVNGRIKVVGENVNSPLSYSMMHAHLGDLKSCTLDQELIELGRKRNPEKDAPKKPENGAAKCVGYSFTVSTPVVIDWELIRSELSAKHPMALVECSSESRYVVIHNSLALKATLLRIKTPTPFKTLDPGVHRITGHFAEWVDWAREVEIAPWGQMGDETQVTVTLINRK